MALTETQAGSSLSDILTSAEPTNQGYYKIKGQKIFISAGDHDGVDNVVHMMLGRIQNAPAGAKGISLFLVPKKRVSKNGELVFNDVRCAGIYRKLGYRGCPLVRLNFGESGDSVAGDRRQRRPGQHVYDHEYRASGCRYRRGIDCFGSILCVSACQRKAPGQKTFFQGSPHPRSRLSNTQMFGGCFFSRGRWWKAHNLC